MVNRHQSPKLVRNTGLILEIDNNRRDKYFAYKITESGKVNVIIAAEDIIA